MEKIITDITERFDNECINFSKEWYNIADYELKILLLVSVLEDNSLAFNGTMKTMCEWLGIKPTATNNKNIKQAIENLNNSGYLEYTHKGQKYIISITDKGLEDNQIVRVRRCWVETLKNYKEQVPNGSIGWLNLLKVFVYIYGSNKSEFTQQEIANNLNISKGTIGTALKILEQCNLKGLYMSKNILKERLSETFVYNIGTQVSIGTLFED